MRGAPGSTLGQRLAALEQREPPAGAGARARCVRAALELLARQAGVTAGTRVVAGYVPGRVELFGKHTDYTGGSSLLAALDRGIAYAACVGSGPIRVVSATEPEAVTLSVGNPVSHVSAPAWGTYVATVVRRLQRNFPAAIGILQGRVALAGDLPPSAGMSSSSALMIALFLALCDLAGVLQPARWPREISTPWGLAHYLACIENGQSYGPLHGEAGVGTFGGSEDHTAILCCRAGRVAQVRFAPTTLVAELPWPDWRLWLGDSGVPAEKTRAARARFNALAIQARQAHTALAAHGYGGEHLAHSVAGLREEAGTDGALNLLCVRLTDAVLCRRAEHLLREEFHYLPAAAAALQDGDLERFGAVAEASHEASRRLLGNIHPAVDALAAAARSEGEGAARRAAAASGEGAAAARRDAEPAASRETAPAASGFGAGFGGSAYAVSPGRGDGQFGERWLAAYSAAWARPAEAQVFPSACADGAQDWSAELPVRWVDKLRLPDLSQNQVTRSGGGSPANS